MVVLYYGDVGNSDVAAMPLILYGGPSLLRAIFRRGESLEFMNLLQNVHLEVIEYLYRGRRAVPLKTFTTRHSIRKLSIVMAVSYTHLTLPTILRV